MYFIWFRKCFCIFLFVSLQIRKMMLSHSQEMKSISRHFSVQFLEYDDSADRISSSILQQEKSKILTPNLKGLGRGQRTKMAQICQFACCMDNFRAAKIFNIANVVLESILLITTIVLAGTGLDNPIVSKKQNTEMLH